MKPKKTVTPRADPPSSPEDTAIFDKAAAAEEHLRSTLNMVENVMLVLGTTVDTARSANAADENTRKAFLAATKAISVAYSTIRNERDKAAHAIHANALKGFRKV